MRTFIVYCPFSFVSNSACVACFEIIFRWFWNSCAMTKPCLLLNVVFLSLKTLHPLLEDGCPGDEIPDESKKVCFFTRLYVLKMRAFFFVQNKSSVFALEQGFMQTAKSGCSLLRETIFFFFHIG